jgi:hypothetical protein
MRTLIIALFLALPMMAQSPGQAATEPTVEPAPPEGKPVNKAPKQVAVVIAPESVRVCSIPLLNVLPQSAAATERMPVYKPAHPERFTMRYARVPAPPCPAPDAVPSR